MVHAIPRLYANQAAFSQVCRCPIQSLGHESQFVIWQLSKGWLIFLLFFLKTNKKKEIFSLKEILNLRPSTDYRRSFTSVKHLQMSLYPSLNGCCFKLSRCTSYTSSSSKSMAKAQSRSCGSNRQFNPFGFHLPMMLLSIFSPVDQPKHGSFYSRLLKTQPSLDHFQSECKRA